jgi:hypothetical protein
MMDLVGTWQIYFSNNPNMQINYSIIFFYAPHCYCSSFHFCPLTSFLFFVDETDFLFFYYSFFFFFWPLLYIYIYILLWITLLLFHLLCSATLVMRMIVSMTTYERLRETHGKGPFNTGKQRSLTKRNGVAGIER